MNMDRPSGPLGVTAHLTGRPIIDSGGTGRQAPSNTVRRVPGPTISHDTSNPSLSGQVILSSAQVVSLAREAMKNALEENQTKAAQASGVINELKPGVTIDLSHKNIQKFPDEVVDIIKTELER